MNPGRPSLAYTYYVLGILSVISILNYYDRNVISIILQPVKKDLRLSDTQIGLLTGLAFAVVYSVLGVPIARFADRGHRVKVLSAAVAVWSVMTAACGFATGFATMFAARMGVGIVEAGGLPSTHALAADYFPPERRSSALSTIAVAAGIGGFLGLAVGGPVSDHFGWRAAFWVGGAPGLLSALIAVATVREPTRRTGAAPAAPTVPLGAALRMLARRRSYIFVTLGLTVSSIGAYAHQTWMPTYFIRSFGLTPGQIGPLFSILTSVPTIVGMLFGGVIVDRWTSKDRRAPVWILIVTLGAGIPLSLIVLLTHDLTMALGASFLGALIGSAWVGPNYALVQGLAGPKTRAAATAIYMMIVNIVGLSLRPVVAGFVSDRLARIAGQESLRWALCAMLIPIAVSLPLFYAAARTLQADLDDAERA